MAAENRNKVVSDAEIKKLASRFKIKADGIPYSQFKKGIKVEMEHGPKNGGVSKDTDVTKGNIVKTAKIALAHLKESPKYYTALSKMEKKLKRGQGSGKSKKSSRSKKGTRPKKLSKGLSKRKKS